MADQPVSALPPAAWYIDPAGRHQYRYWDGATWTDHVADNGAQSLDPLTATPVTRREARQQARASRDELARQQQENAARERAEAEKQRLAARAEAEARAAREAQEREHARLAKLAREAEAKEAAARALREAEEREARILDYPPFYLPEYNGYPSTNVAGEFYHLDAIHAALGRRPKIDEEIVAEALLAALVPEPTNPYDRNAVKVIIDGQHVGYLEKEVAAVVQPILRRIIEAGHLPLVGARIWASARRSYEDARKAKYYVNIRVSLNYLHLLLPLNDPPHEDYSIIPWGSTLQVVGEERHQDVLADHVSADGDALVIGTLVVVQGGTPKAPRDLIEVRIDGERIGQLTPGSSQHFIPTVRHLDAQGQTAAVWLRVIGSAIAAQVTIHATRAHELPGDWFSAPHTAPRLHGPRRSPDDAALDDAEIRATRQTFMWDD